MEGLILLGLAGVGYVVNRNTNTHRIENNIRPKVFQNNNSSIYDLNNVSDAQKYEVQLVKDNFKQSMDPSSNKVNHYGAKDKVVTPKEKLIEGMDGSYLSESQFMTNDQGVRMAPYFRGEGPAAVK